MNRFALTVVMLLSINSLVGCATLEVPYAPMGHACGTDPILGSCHACGVCGGTCEGHTPASFLGHQLRCTAGCGEIYWGPEFDNPAPCDPCDECFGEFVGDRCCEPKLRQKLWWKLTGQHGHAGHGKGCSSCGGKGCSSCGGKGDTEFVDEPYYEYEGETIAPYEAPTPASPPSTPRPAAPEVETPAFLRPAQGVSLPFQLRSTRMSQ
ncbi:MAG: hypothetical protein ABI614_03445 [Planctomycetota bacterium]